MTPEESRLRKNFLPPHRWTASPPSHLSCIVKLGRRGAVVPGRVDDGHEVLLVPLLAGNLGVQVVDVRSMVLAVMHLKSESECVSVWGVGHGWRGEEEVSPSEWPEEEVLHTHKEPFPRTPPMTTQPSQQDNTCCVGWACMPSSQGSQ